ATHPRCQGRLEESAIFQGRVRARQGDRVVRWVWPRDSGRETQREAITRGRQYPCAGTRTYSGGLALGLPWRVVAGHQRCGEIHAGKVSARQIRFAQDGDAHVRAGERRAVYVCHGEICVAEERTAEVGVREIAAAGFESSGLR